MPTGLPSSVVADPFGWLDDLVMAALVASVWLNLYLCSDRILASADIRSARPHGSRLLRWLRGRRGPTPPRR